MDIQYIIDRAQGIILNPKEEWRRIKEEPKSNAELLLHYVLPLVVLAVFTGFIGSWSLTIAVFQFISPFIGIVIAAYVINELAEKFNSTKNLNNAFKLVVYAATPSLLAAIVANLSFLLGWVSLFGLYGIYLFWVGIIPMMNTPQDKRLGYVLASALVIVIIQIVLFTLIGPSTMWTS
ncbi:Yip1 family protein [Fodinibius sp.]|uniref:Yip1 family protein n=1 Tax=Fodinibius sp. TaxID=1872440 RepID=UPI003569FEC2